MGSPPDSADCSVARIASLYDLGAYLLDRLDLRVEPAISSDTLREVGLLGHAVREQQPSPSTAAVAASPAVSRRAHDIGSGRTAAGRRLVRGRRRPTATASARSPRRAPDGQPRDQARSRPAEWRRGHRGALPAAPQGHADALRVVARYPDRVALVQSRRQTAADLLGKLGVAAGRHPPAQEHSLRHAEQSVLRAVAVDPDVSARPRVRRARSDGDRDRPSRTRAAA